MALLTSTLTIQQAQNILNKHALNSPVAVSIEEFPPPKSSTQRSLQCLSYKSFSILVSDKLDVQTYFIMIVSPPPSDAKITPNPLKAIDAILSTLRTSTSIPLFQHTLDTSASIISHDYVLYHPISSARADRQLCTLSYARSHSLLSPKELASIELRLGTYFAQTHAVQNDWFGSPSLASDALSTVTSNLPSYLTSDLPDTAYSWQETFVSLLESALAGVHSILPELDIPYESIRRSLSRAIGSFLFDDVEVPTLVMAISEDDVLVSVPGSTQVTTVNAVKDSATYDVEPEIHALLPALSHAVWAEPLFEPLFSNNLLNGSGPSKVLLEGYGKPLIVFARQRTKRVWYDLYAALTVLLEDAQIRKNLDISKNDEEKLMLGVEVERKWAVDVLLRCVETLKDAPCY